MKMKKFFSELAEWRSFTDIDNEKTPGSFFISTYKFINTKSNKYDILITIFLISLHIFSYFYLVKNFLAWNGSEYFHHSGLSWGKYHHALDSWLISYDGGFIRRGLSGEIVKFIELITGILPHIIVAVISIFTFILLMFWIIKICGKNIPIYFIFSPFFFAISARWDILFSTDYFILLLYLCALKIIVSNYNILFTIFMINIVCTIAILVKEIYIFSFLPMLIIIYNFKNYKNIFSLKFLPIFAIPISAAIAVSLNTYNTPELLFKTSEYWNEVYRVKIPEFCCFENGYFHFFKNSWISEHLPKLRDNWKIFLLGFIWLPLFWLFVWYFCGLFTAKLIKHYDAGREKNYLKLYYISTFFSLPMWILAMDWGRWILFASITSFLATYLIPKSTQLPKILEFIQINVWKGPLRFWQKILVVTCVGIPSFVADFGWVYMAAPIWFPITKIF